MTNQLEDPQNSHNPHLGIITQTRSFIIRTSIIILLISTKNVVDPHNSSQNRIIRMLIMRACPTSLMILLISTKNVVDPHNSSQKPDHKNVDSESLSNQSDDLAGLADNLEVLEPFQDERDVERADSHQVDHVHGVS